MVCHTSHSACDPKRNMAPSKQTTQGIFRCKFGAFIESLIKKKCNHSLIICLKNALNMGSKEKNNNCALRNKNLQPSVKTGEKTIHITINIIWALLFWKRREDFLCHPQCEWHQLSYPRLLWKSENRARDKKHQKKDLHIQFNTRQSLYKKDLLPMHRREEPWGPEESESVTVLTWSTNRTCIHVTN